MSCLCVTEDRSAFLPWLLWNYDKQDHSDRELVVVDSSVAPPSLPQRDDVRVVRCPKGITVARKRNLAVAAARGRALTWFDDDDWQHPRKLSILDAALGDGELLAGSVQSFFVELAHGRCRPHRWGGSILFNSSGIRRDVLQGIHFDESRARAADTAWLTSVRHRARGGGVVVAETLFFWLCHKGNLSNPARRYAFPHSIGVVRDAVGDTAWEDTDHQLTLLRRRLERTRSPRT